MNYGLYVSAAGALTSLHRQDVVANNLANLNTVGFKPDSVFTKARLPERLESGESFADPQYLLEQLGGGQHLHPTFTSFEQGDLAETHNNLDVAIMGEGFFAIQSGRGPDSIRLTRDGRFTMNADGELVMSTSGMHVLDTNDQPIRLNRNAPVRIDPTGAIVQNGAQVAQLQLTTVPDKRQLAKEGESLFRMSSISNGRMNRRAATGSLRQGYTESSGVDPILALNDMINASKAVQSNATMMQYHDNLMGQAINTFGRVA